jgi:hypothetical protein
VYHLSANQGRAHQLCAGARPARWCSILLKGQARTSHAFALTRQWAGWSAGRTFLATLLPCKCPAADDVHALEVTGWSSDLGYGGCACPAAACCAYYYYYYTRLHSR